MRVLTEDDLREDGSFKMNPPLRTQADRQALEEQRSQLESRQTELDTLPIYEQLVQAFKESMLNGELSPGDMLPSIRSLAKDLEISVITTKRAYEELESENLIYSHPGKGFFVKQVDFRTLQEEQLVQLEHALSSCIEDAKKLSLSLDEVQDLIQLLWKGRD